MKSVIYTKTGSVDILKQMDVTKPVPNDNQVLVEVRASTVSLVEKQLFKSQNGKAAFSSRFIAFMLGCKGKPLGGEISGIAIEVGKNIHGITKGDEVYGKTLGILPINGHAEYALLDKKHVCAKPSNLSFEESAALPMSCETALGAVRKADIKAGQQVMIYGASGGVGQYAVQFAKAAGAIVSGVCSTRNIEMARSIGCDYVINYKNEDFTKAGKTYDRIIGINGNNPLSSYKKVLKDDGVFVGVGGGSQVVFALFASIFSRTFSVFAVPLMPVNDYLSYTKELAEKNKINPYIDSVFSIKDVKNAIKYLVAEHAQGKVVVKMDFSD